MKNCLIDFVRNWTEGTARHITEKNREMLVEVSSCPNPFPDELAEEIGVPSGSTCGEVARQIRDVLEEAGLGDPA